MSPDDAPIPPPQRLAEALSSHRFDEVIPYLADSVEWDLVGEVTLEGREAVVDALRETAAGLADVRTEFTRFVVVARGDAVVVDSVAAYLAADGDRSVVSSCDVYEFEGGRIARIRSYNVELG